MKKKDKNGRKKNGRSSFIHLCPGCGQMLYHQLAQRDKHFGSPFRPCPQCGQEYFDPRWEEPALLRHPRHPFLPSTVWGCVLVGTAFLLGALFLEQRRLELILMGALFFGTGVWYGIDWRKGAAERDAQLQGEIDASARRLLAPAYCKKLAEYGVKLPDHLL